MMDRFELFSDCGTNIPLLSLDSFKSLYHSFHCGFYGSSNEQNWMHELRTFSQIRSHMYIHLGDKLLIKD